MAAKQVPDKATPKRAKKDDSAKPSKALHEAARTASGLEAGAKAPAFTLPRDGGGTVSLQDFAGRKLVLYFYPRADTPGCTKESIDFSRLKPAFARAGADILGVSADAVSAQDAFKAKHKLAISLGSDESRKMLEAYGVWQEKSLYGRKFFGIVRSTFLIGPDQRIAQVWPRVSVDGHAEAVLAAVKAL
jgi:peroxiredoxin Q/BCP